MLVVSDIDDVFLPKPTDLLVNLAEARASLEALLARINDMFKDNLVVGSALGPALQAGFKLMVIGFSVHVCYDSSLAYSPQLVVK
jgi:protein transport protein SEC24